MRKNGCFTTIGLEKVALDPNDVAEIELLLDKFVVRDLGILRKTFDAGMIAVEKDLNPVMLVLDVCENILSHGADENEPSRDLDAFGTLALSLIEGLELAWILITF